MEKLTVIDIETENTGYDIMKHNKRIISVQMFDGQKGSIFYDGSNKNSIDAAKSSIESQINEGYKFVGFNIRNFDVPLIKNFLGVEIPGGQIIEISEMSQMNDIRKNIGKQWPRLFEICDHLGIECSHKGLMDSLSMKFRTRPDVVALAKKGAENLVKEKGWGLGFSHDYALGKVAGGMAILDSFNEFVGNRGDTKSLFYKYAMGDVFAEHRLFEALKKM
ncbi:MAG: ribonuclease H-like domain-containing protein [Candidatus Bathyarchaeia archaeon]